MLNPPTPALPIIDLDNPCWVPEVPAERLLADIRRVSRKDGRASAPTPLARFPFIKRLTLTLTAETFDRSCPSTIESSYVSEELSVVKPGKRSLDSNNSHQPPNKRRKISDLSSPFEHSSVSEEGHDSLRSRFAELERRCHTLEHAITERGTHLRSPFTSPSPISLSPFITQLRSVCHLPYLEECDTFDEVASYLSEEGSLDVLRVFRQTSVEAISLTASMSNQAADSAHAISDVLRVFALPESFRTLRTLDLTGIQLEDRDVASISRLPMLECLHLGETEISGEALCHLVALKSTLRILHVQDNPLIDDDAVPCLGYLFRLSFLAIYGTGITMQGIRKLALKLDKDGRDMSCNMPEECNTYIDHLTSHYDVNPAPPLITSPEAVTTLTISALKANLAGHQAFNKDIALTGTKKEMAERLSKILETRKLDLLAKCVFRREEISELEISMQADYGDTYEDEDSLVPYGTPLEDDFSQR